MGAAVLAIARQRQAIAAHGLARSATGLFGAWIATNRQSLAFSAAALTVAAGALVFLGFSTILSANLVMAVVSCLCSIAGLAFAPIAHMVLQPFIPDRFQLLQTVLVCSVANQALAIVWLWRELAWRDLPSFFLGGVLGLPIGVLMLLRLPAHEFRVAFGLTLLVYGVVAAIRPPIVLRPMGRWADTAVGFIGGITGGLATFPSAPVSIWCSMKGWDKTRQRGLYQPFILGMQFLALTLAMLMRSRTGGAAPLSWHGFENALAFVPISLIGTWAGLRVFGRISDRRFEQWMAGLLAAVGLIMVV
jgi:uncharacterized membrane protein YfcA